MASSSASAKVCFNSSCNQVLELAPRKNGWPRRTGEFAGLCDRCARYQLLGGLQYLQQVLFVKTCNGLSVKTFKWRKIPADALLPSGWSCSKNQWNPERSLCSADEELTSKELDKLFPRSVWAASKSKKAAKLEPDQNERFVEGLDRLADLAIQETGEAASQLTTKHPRHKLDCTSGKDRKHKPSCICPICVALKYSLNTLMLRREQKHFEKAEKKVQDTVSCEQPDEDDYVIIFAENGDNCLNHKMGTNEGSW